MAERRPVDKLEAHRCSADLDLRILGAYSHADHPTRCFSSDIDMSSRAFLLLAVVTLTAAQSCCAGGGDGTFSSNV
jgi:hypothetical protein